VILALNDFLSQIGKDMREGQIVLSEYIINKALTRAPSEYSDYKSLPHVKVALALKAQGKSEAELVNNIIPYLVVETSDPKASLADKAIHPDHFNKGRCCIDVDWYITQQVLPPITRLIEHIDGIELDFVA